MKKIILLYVFFLSAIGCFAQKQTFEQVSYTAPKAWKKEVRNDIVGYTFINTKDKSWCRIAIYKSTASKGNIDLDFNSEWDMLIAKPYKTKIPPQMNEPQEANGWKIKAGGSSFKYNNQDALAMVTTFTGYDKCFSIIATCNNEKYVDSIQNFIQSIELKEQQENKEPVIKRNTVTNSNIIGSWGKSNAVSQINNRYGTYSYNKQQYYFNTNGTYTFLGKNYSEDYAETILIKENGTYVITGNQLQIIPKSSVIESWSKKNGADNWGQLKSSQKRALEKVTYQYNMEGRNLILSTSKETTRDGRFSNGNNYTYGPPETFTAIKLPGQ